MKVEINNKRTGKCLNTWKLKCTLLNHPGITEEIKGEIENYLETNKTGSTIYQNLRDAANPVLRRKFVTINACIKRQKDIR